ncbi:pyridoxamine 5'-phosphate oxidase family protein [Ahrensia sp. R2A130]|uniref:pyridoxamine 5'-phosphate oxidase family protein n=1 Tax=Ahrensia sp. R2A130 TaxID=744979 RepID=UPI0001E0F0BD|nr:pyridoxamine 5'-phosphate oxidase family protein [Ahrensia sp. R2A130]EFL89170.1 pyridoxamine 5'-phosphate oxidase family protein [Ahrensia sp. R2A130]
MDSFADLMFTDAVAVHQKADGSYDRFQKMYANRFKGDLGEDERTFIESRTSFYIASHNADGWPYVQHRGGPVGFLKVIGPTRLGFADYAGNHQFVTQGNLDDDNRVSLFMMDYPRKARLKMLGHATMIAASDDTGLAAQLATEDGPEPERLVTIDIAAMDWNCPKYIEPRFTEAEIAAMLGPRIKALEERNVELEAELAHYRKQSGSTQ